MPGTLLVFETTAAAIISTLNFYLLIRWLYGSQSLYLLSVALP